MLTLTLTRARARFYALITILLVTVVEPLNPSNLFGFLEPLNPLKVKFSKIKSQKSLIPNP